MSRFQSRKLRDSSPRADDYHTGVSSINLEEALHSTQQFGNTEQDQWPSQWDKAMDRNGSDGSDGSASMSIELGRGVKRAGEELNDLSSNAVFTFGDDSQYELTGTPPLKATYKKSGNNLRREASIRMANEGAKRTASRTVSGAKAEPISLQARLANNKNTRFTKKTVIPNEPSARLAQFTGDTATSFAVPDISNVSALINPLGDTSSRGLPVRASRFTPSATHRMPVRFEGTDRVPVQSVPIPEDEKKIYAALQALQEKVNQLEYEHGEMLRQLDRAEKENIQLSNALAREEQLRRPDSALGSEDETAQEKWRLERTKLQSRVRTLEQHLAKSEQKNKLREDELKKSVKEKQDLFTQLGVECYRLQEIESENMALRDDHERLRREVLELRQQLYSQRMPTQRSLADEIASKTRRSSGKPQVAKPAREHTQEVKARELTINFEDFDSQARRVIAETVKQQAEYQRLRKNQSTGVRTSMFDLDSRSRMPRSATTPHFQQYQAAVQDETNEEVYTEFELTKNGTQNFSRRSTQDLEDNMTSLTVNDPVQTRSFRQELEAQRRAGHLKRHSSAPVDIEQATNTFPKAARRSSLRDPAELNATKDTRTVRVQSPAIDDLTEASLPRRHEEGETSEFIIPDITLHRRLSASKASEHIKSKHDSPSCTVCNNTDIHNTSAPQLVRISTRTDLPDDATVRPSQPPHLALSAVLRQLHDELDHLKLNLANYQQMHAENEPSVGARERKRLYNKIREATAEVKRKEDQIYALYDALEGQLAYDVSEPVRGEKVRPVERASGLGFDGALDAQTDDESVGLPAWDGLSDDEH